MGRETIINTLLALLFLAISFGASAMSERFYVTLATRIAVLALAVVELNIAPRLGGLVSFGHLTFFGLGGYVAGILPTHAFDDVSLFAGILGTA